MVGGAVAEIIVGVKRDPVLGLALVIGAGGVLVNLVEDTARLLLPTTAEEIEAALSGLKVAKLLSGYRGKPAGDRQALIAAIQDTRSRADRGTAPTRNRRNPPRSTALPSASAP